jgi:hypothetical protein
VNVATRVLLTPFTTIVGSAATSTHRFDVNHRRDADGQEALIGAEWRSGGVLSGDARVGYMKYLSVDPGNPDVQGVIGDIDVFYRPFDLTRFGVKLSRSTGDTYHKEFNFAVVDRLGGSIQQGFRRRYDLLLESYLERFQYQGADFPDGRALLSYETSFRHIASLGIRFGPVRVGFNATYLQRYADFIQGRNYNTFQLAANVTYGIVQVRADQ